AADDDSHVLAAPQRSKLLVAERRQFIPNRCETLTVLRTERLEVRFVRVRHELVEMLSTHERLDVQLFADDVAQAFDAVGLFGGSRESQLRQRLTDAMTR